MEPVSKNLATKQEVVCQILTKHGRNRDSLVAVLHDVQKEIGCLSEEALTEVASGLDIPLSKVYGVATFYTMFSLKPRGSHIIRVCENAPCHVLGAKAVVASLERELGIPMGGETPDGRFTLEYTSCLGVCGVAPAIMIDDAVYGNLTSERIPMILREYR